VSNIHDDARELALSGNPAARRLSIDDDPTIPVNRGAAGVYMPEPNEKTRARVGLVQAAERYIATTNCDFDVFDISANNGNVYQLRITKMR
jgi:hypothetical protein